MSEIRDLAPLMTSRDLLERLLATVDEVVNDEPARGSIRGCAITLAARLEQAEKILPADEVCACLDETGGRQVRIYERDALEGFMGDVLAGCDIQRGARLFRQVEVVIGPGKTRAEIRVAALERRVASLLAQATW